MSVPAWLSDALQEPGDSSHSISDVADAITQIRLKLVTEGNWTEPSAGLFKSVPTASGVFFDVLVTRIDADTLEFRVRDHNVNTLWTGRIDINAGATTVDYYWGDNYLVVVAQKATPEVFQVYLLDPTAVGAVDADIANRLVAVSYRDSAGTTSATRILVGCLNAFDNAVAAQLSIRDRKIGSSSTASVGMLGPGGRYLYQPMICNINQSGTWVWTGCLPMVLSCPDTLAYGTVKQVPVDTGTNKAFKVLPLGTPGSEARRAMIRCPSQDV